MTSANAIRYLAHEAARCHKLTLTNQPDARDAHSMLCLLFPSVLEALELQPMDDFEIRAFRFEFQETLKRHREIKLLRQELKTMQKTKADELAHAAV